MLHNAIIILFFKNTLPITASLLLVGPLLTVSSVYTEDTWNCFFFTDDREFLCWNICVFASYSLAVLHRQLPLLKRYREVIPTFVANLSLIHIDDNLIRLDVNTITTFCDFNVYL